MFSHICLWFGLAILCVEIGPSECKPTEDCRQQRDEFCDASHVLEPPFNLCVDCTCFYDCQAGYCCFLQSTFNKTKIDGTVCSRSTFGHELVEDMYGLYMVNTCPADDSERSLGDCGTQRVEPWGSLSPVFSPERKLVYKNIHCANCHNVNDSLALISLIVCNQTVIGRDAISIDEIMTNIKTNFADQPFCYVHYILPDPVSRAGLATFVNIAYLQCFPSIVSSCNRSSGSATPEWIYFCENGPYSPVLSMRNSPIWYKNRVCMYCNEDSIESLIRPKELYTIKKFYEEIKPAGDSGSFTFMLSATQEETYWEVDSSEVPLKSVCVAATSGQENVCRSVFCPSSRSVDYDGSCGSPVIEILEASFQICLNVTLTPSIQEHYALRLVLQADSKGKRFPGNLKSPWARSWDSPKHVLYQSLNGYVSNFIYVLVQPYGQKPYKWVLTDAERSINKQWKIQIDNKTVTVSHTLSNLCSFKVPSVKKVLNESSEVLPVDLENITNEEEYILNQYSGSLNEHVYSFHDFKEMDVNTFYHKISKFAFCEQIELKSEDVYLFQNNHILFVNISGQILFSEQFYSYKYANTTEKVYRICLEDAHLPVAASSTNSYGAFLHYMLISVGIIHALFDKHYVLILF